MINAVIVSGAFSLPIFHAPFEISRVNAQDPSPSSKPGKQKESKEKSKDDSDRFDIAYPKMPGGEN